MMVVGVRIFSLSFQKNRVTHVQIVVRKVVVAFIHSFITGS